MEWLTGEYKECIAIKEKTCYLCQHDILYKSPYVRIKYVADGTIHNDAYHKHCYRLLQIYKKDKGTPPSNTEEVNDWLREKVCEDCWKYEDDICTEKNIASCIEVFKKFNEEEINEKLGSVSEKRWKSRSASDDGDQADVGKSS